MKRELPDDEAGNLGVEEISGFPDGSDSKESTCSVGAAAAAKLPESCLTLCDPLDGSPPGSPSLIFSMKVKSESEVAQWCPTLSDHGLQLTRLLHPWDFPGKSTGVGCHCLLQQCRRPGFNSWVFLMPWRREWHPTLVFLPGIYHAKSPVGLQCISLKLDTTEKLT